MVRFIPMGACTVAGGAVGAVLRYLTSTAWPHPGQVLASTLITATVAFVIVGAMLGIVGARGSRGFVAGVCGAAASLSAYSIIGVGQTPLLAAAFLILTPICAFAGLLAGVLLYGAVTALRTRSATPR